MVLLFIWLMMAGVVAIIANSKGFDASGWFFYGVLIWPIALAHVIVKPAINREAIGTKGDATSSDQPTRTCPECAETIKAAAMVCRFCGNRAFPAEPELSEEEAFFASLGASPSAPPPPTTWQKLWWNPNAKDRKR